MAPLITGAPILAKRGLTEPNVSIAHIFYQYKFFRSEKKDELIGFTELLCKLEMRRKRANNGADFEYALIFFS